MKKTLSALVALTVTVASVMFGPATAGAAVVAAPPTLTIIDDVGSSTVTWEEPGSAEPITGYSVRLNAATEILLSASDARQIDIGWNDGTIGATSPTAGELLVDSGSSLLIEVAAISGGTPQPSTVMVVNSGGTTQAAAAEVTVLSRVADSVTLQLSPAVTPLAPLVSWTVVAQNYASDMAVDGGALVVTHVSETGGATTVEISGLSTTDDLAFSARGSAAAEGDMPVYRTEWGMGASALLELEAAPVPTISGTTQVGATLAAVAGEWQPAPVQLSYQWLRNGSVLDGANGNQYVLQSADVGARMSVVVTGAKSGYIRADRTSAETAIVANGAISSAPTPTISGTAKVGLTLTASAGSWGPAPIGLTYQWLRAGALISGATAPTYTPTASDLGATLAVRVTGGRGGFTSVARTSGSTAAVVVGTLASATPTISGTVKVGSKLTAIIGAWGPSPVALGYQWFRSGTTITGATASTYTPVIADLGATLTVRVTGSMSGFSTVSKTSLATSKVGLGTLTAPTPTITGTVRVGSKLTAVPNTWGPAAVALSYQWFRNGSAITGAAASTYVLMPADLDGVVTVKVTGKKSGFATTAKASAATVAVARGVLSPTPTPTISGTSKVNVTLTAVPGTWGPGTVSRSYQWFRSGVVISGATASTYLLAPVDIGKVITVTVTGRKTGYTSVAKTSAGTTGVASGTLTAPTPKISGTLKVPNTLKAAPGTWGPGTVSLKYQWYRDSTAISGATASTYKLSGSDAGALITAKVTGSKTGYTTAAKTSAATTAIARGTLTSTPVPTISGTVKVGSRLTANAGTWRPGTVTLSYQWYRSGSAISGATGSTYVLTSSDAGKAMTVKVTGRKTGYTPVAKTSASTAAVTVPIRISGDGVRLVPSQVPRGTYVTTSKSTDFCYWETMSGFGGSFEEIVSNDIGYGQRIMELTGAAVGVTTERCGSWVRLSDTPTSRKSFVAGDGVWSVQKQIAPGLYRASSGANSCYWARTSDFTGDLGSIIDNYIGSAPNPIVRISSTDAGFESSRCGSWTRISD